MKVTKKLTYRAIGLIGDVKIPAGLKVIPADNLPDDNDIKYWLWELPKDATDQMKSWHRNYSFGLYENEVKDIKS